MRSRNRAKSLPSLRIEAQRQPSFVFTGVPAVPALPSQYRSLTVAKRRITAAKPLFPAWDREIDVTFNKNLVPNAGDDYKITNSPGNEHSPGEATGIFDNSKKATRDLESHTYAAIISILNYVESHKDPMDNNFRRVVNHLHQSRGGSVSRNEMCFLFKFPEAIRRKIWDFILTDHSGQVYKPVRLQPFNPFFKDVWTSEGFQSTKELFTSSWGAMATCHALRAELLASILTVRRFHFVFSPFAKEGICPQMFHWIDCWSQLMENVTIELDLSKLGFGPTPEAENLLWGEGNIAAGMRRFVSIQATNRTTPIDSLVLLARRYHGIRPNLANSPGQRPYCPPNADFAAAAAIVKLKNRINKLRIVGFNASTTNTVIEAIFPEINFADREELRKHGGMVGISRIWPLLDGQASIHRDTRFPQQAESLALPRNVKSTINTMTRNVSKARSQIEKLKDMIEAYDTKKQRGQEAKIELDDERNVSKTARCNTPLRPRSSTARLRGNSKRSVSSQISSGTESTPREQPDLPKDRQSSGFEESASEANILGVPILHTGEIKIGKKHSDGNSDLMASEQHDISDQIQYGIAKNGDFQCTSQVNDISIHKMGNLRRHENKLLGDQNLRKNDKWSLKSRVKSMSMSMEESSSPQPVNLDSVNQRGTRQILKKKSFGDFLRGSPRLEVGGGDKRSKMPGQDPSKSYFDFDDDKDTRSLWRGMSLKEAKLKLRT